MPSSESKCEEHKNNKKHKKKFEIYGISSFAIIINLWAWSCERLFHYFGGNETLTQSISAHSEYHYSWVAAVAADDRNA